MIKNLSKADYYKEKRIPTVAFCRKLEPELPARTHLIEALPRLGTEFEKIKSQQVSANQTNLELANALKIIHELEYELEVATCASHQYEEELLLSRNENKELLRKIARLESTVSGLESQMQKSEFSVKVRIQCERQQYHITLAQYEKKLESLNQAYSRLKADREKELKSAVQFNENNLSRANLQMQEFELTAQNDIKRLQTEIDKAVRERSQLQQKITELETCNQEHLRQLQKANMELSQTNTRLKTDYEHKINWMQTELSIALARSKELSETVISWERKMSKSIQMWEDEKKALNRQSAESENSWKSNYESLVKQKEKLAQQLSKKNIEICDKEKELGNMKQIITKMEREAVESGKEKKRISDDSERSIKELHERLRFEHQTKFSDIQVQHQRELTRKVFDAVEEQKKVLEQKHREQVLKYIENVRVLQNQLLDGNRKLMDIQDAKRKLQITVDQSKMQIEYLTKCNSEVKQASRIQMDSMQADFDYRTKNMQSVHKCEMERLHNDLNRQIENVKVQAGNKQRELCQIIDTKEQIIRDIDSRFRRYESDAENIKGNLIKKVQTLETDLSQMKKANDEMANINRQLNQNLLNLEAEFRNLDNVLRQEINIKNRMEVDLNNIDQENQNLRGELSRREVDYIEKSKALQLEMYESKRKETGMIIEIEACYKRIRDFESKCSSLESQLKQQEQNKVQLQRKLSEIDISSQEKWKTIEADFAAMNKRLTEEASLVEHSLRQTITRNQQIISAGNKKIEELEVVLVKERTELKVLSATWSSRTSQLEQANKRLMKSSSTLQDLEKENISKEEIIRSLKKEIEKIKSQSETIAKDLSGKLDTSHLTVDKLTSDLETKNKQIKAMQSQLSQISSELVAYKQRIAKQEQSHKIQQNTRTAQLRKQQDELKNTQRQLSEVTEKYAKVSDQKQKLQAEIKQMQRAIEEEEQRRRADKKSAIQRVSELESALEQTESSYKQRLAKLESEKESLHKVMLDRESDIVRLNKKIGEIQVELLTVTEELKSFKTKLESEKKTTVELRSERQTLKSDKAEFEKRTRLLMEQIQKFEKEIEKTERDISKIYEESDKRVEVAVEETKILFEKQIAAKVNEIETIKRKTKQVLQQETEQWRRKESKISEEKQSLYKEVVEKSCKISEITIAYEELGQAYEQAFRELQVYKKKWNKMFCEFTDNNEELSEINFKLADFRTEERKVKKVMRETHEIRTEKTEKLHTMHTAADNQTPVSQNASKNNENVHTDKNVSAFSQGSGMEGSGVRQSGGSKIMTNLLSNSGVVVSSLHSSKNTSSDVSSGLECSSASSKFSSKEQ